jgi:hypothetical protein
VGFQRRRSDHDEFAAQVRGHLADLFDQGAGRDHSQEAIVEMLPELVLLGSRPARGVGAGKTGDHPAQLGQGVAFRRGGADLLQPGPAGQAMLPGDGRLGLMQGGEFARGQAAFRLEL